MKTYVQVYYQDAGAIDTDDTPMDAGWYLVGMRYSRSGPTPFGISCGPFATESEANRAETFVNAIIAQTKQESVP